LAYQFKENKCYIVNTLNILNIMWLLNAQAL